MRLLEIRMGRERVGGSFGRQMEGSGKGIGMSESRGSSASNKSGKLKIEKQLLKKETWERQAF